MVCQWILREKLLIINILSPLCHAFAENIFENFKYLNIEIYIVSCVLIIKAVRAELFDWNNLLYRMPGAYIHLMHCSAYNINVEYTSQRRAAGCRANVKKHPCALALSRLVLHSDE